MSARPLTGFDLLKQSRCAETANAVANRVRKNIVLPRSIKAKNTSDRVEEIANVPLHGGVYDLASGGSILECANAVDHAISR